MKRALAASGSRRETAALVLFAAFAPLAAAGCSRAADAGSPPKRGKLDLLLAIDNSPSMAVKHEILAASVPRLVDRLLNPVCRTAGGRGVAIGASKGGDCRALPGWDASVEPEFPAVGDLVRLAGRGDHRRRRGPH